MNAKEEEEKRRRRRRRKTRTSKRFLMNFMAGPVGPAQKCDDLSAWPCAAYLY